MATSLFFMSPNPSPTNDDMSAPKMAVPGSENAARTDPIQRQPRARRPSNKTPVPNRQRRRGLGVAELERLSSQDRMKRMTEIPSTAQFFTSPSSGAGGYFDLEASHRGAAGPFGLQGYCMTSPPASNFPGAARGFVVPVTGGVAGGRVVGSPYGQLVGAPVVLAEASRSELTSLPNNNGVQQQQCSSIVLDSCCSICSKEKEMAVLERAKSAERKVRSSTRKKMMDSRGDFLELNLGNYSHGGSAAQSYAVNCCEGTTGGYVVLDKEVEVMAVRRKKNSMPSSIGGTGGRNSNSRLVLEYEFFPGKANTSSSSLPQEPSSSSYAPQHSSSIDLSLKLSYNNNNNNY